MSEELLTNAAEIAEQVPNDQERPWPAVMAFLTAWLLPATTARRTLRVRLISAYSVHILASLATFVLVCFLAATNARENFGFILNEIAEEYARHPRDMVLITIFSFLSIELGFLVLALIVMPWGAGDEPLRSSYAHALRQTWLHTTHALPLVLVIGLWMNHYYKAYSNSWKSYYQAPAVTYPTLPGMPPNVASDSPEMQAYEKAMEEYQQQVTQFYQQHAKAWRGYRHRQSFYVKWGEVFIGYTCFAAALWILWALFRAVGIRRPLVPVARPPLCEFCGYNLTGTNHDGLCPECGQPIIKSLGPEVRPGTPWERRRQVGRLRAWRQCCWATIRRPKEFGQQIKVTSQTRDHGIFLLIHLVPFFFLGVASVLWSYAILGKENPFTAEEGMVLLGVAPMTGYFSFVGALCLAMLTANLVGIYASVIEKRNLLPATTQMASYLSGYLFLWACIVTGCTVLIVKLGEAGVFNDLQRLLWIDDEILVFVSWMLPYGLLFLGYVYLTWRGTVGARYANH